MIINDLADKSLSPSKSFDRFLFTMRMVDFYWINCRVLKGGCSRDGSNWAGWEDCGTLGKTRGITTPP